MIKSYKRLKVLSTFIFMLIIITTVVVGSNMNIAKADTTWTFYVYDLNKYDGATKMADWYDECLFVSTLQGIVNQDGPNLYIRDYIPSKAMSVTSQYETNNINRNWLEKFTQKGQWLSEANIVVLTSINDLISTFSSKLTGVVVWDPKVDATVNVATTIAGVERAPIVMGGGELYMKVTSSPNNLTVKKNLVGMFSGVNSKTDAYAWAKSNYLDNGLANAGVLSCLDDGYARQPGSTGPQSFTVERDSVVKRKGFAMDLSVWDDEKPIDAPEQALGTDRNTLLSILQKAYDLKGQYWPIDVVGFYPWWNKYSDYLDRGKHGPCDGEWKLVEEFSKKNGGLLTACDWVGCMNASFHSWAPVGKGMVNVPKAPARKTIENKTYILFCTSDFDGGFFHNLAHLVWDDKLRGTIPIYWGITPGIYKDYPDILQYIYDTATPNDYFGASASSVVYSNPDFCPGLNTVWSDYNREAYKRSGYTMSSFVINGNAGTVSANAEKVYSTFSGDGSSILQTQMTTPIPAVRNDNMSISELVNAQGYYEVDPFAAGINSYAASLPNIGSQPNFITIRSTFTTPSIFVDVYKKILADHPEYHYEAVDPFTFYSLIRQAKDNQPNDAIELSSNIPDRMVAGASYNVSVKMRNVGSNSWTKNTSDRLGDTGYNDFIWSNLNGGYSNGLGDQRVYLSDEETIVPQQIKEWNFTVTAPASSGSYTFAAQMVRDNSTWMGNVYTKTVNVVAASGDQAVVTSVTVPDTLVEGANGMVSVTVKNVGSTTWTAANNYRLGSGYYSDPFYEKTISNGFVWTNFANGGENSVFNQQRAYLAPGDSIAPGQSKTFSFSVTAPSKRGRYVFSGSMVHDDVCWFGSDSRFEKEIKVVPSGRSGFDAGFIDSTVPLYMKTNTKQMVTISFKNVGTEVWTEANEYRLGSTTSNQFIFSDFKDAGYSTSATNQRVYLNDSDEINPEDSKSFTFAINAPSTSGDYTVSVDMIHENVTWLNQPVSFTVHVVDSDYDCEMTNSNIPATIPAGSKATLVLEFLNKGNNFWTQDDFYRLGATNNNQILFTDLSSSTGYSTSATNQRIYLEDFCTVDRGKKCQFKFNIKAPDTTGTYTLEFRMVRDGVCWFGPTYTYTINVNASYTKMVNCGGGSFTAGNGDAWLADQVYTSGSWGYSGTSSVASTTDSITFNNDKSYQEPDMYKCARKGSSFSYKFDVPNGKYKLTLHFAEIEKTQSFARLFTVKAEGRSIITGFDIYKMNLGHDKAWFPYNIFNKWDASQCLVDVTDGQLNLDFTGDVDNAMVNGIEVMKLN